MTKQMNLVSDRADSIVVHPTPGLGDATTIADALAMLPATGGSLLLREGTYNITTTITLPDAPVRIAGCGQSSIISIGANVIAAFTVPVLANKRNYVLEDFDVIGTSVAAQTFLSYGESNSRAVMFINRVNTSGIQWPFNVTAGTSAEPVILNVDNCHFAQLADLSSMLINCVNASLTVYAYMQRVRFYDAFEDAITGTFCPNIIGALGVNFLGSDNYFSIGTSCTVGCLNLTDSAIINFGPNPNPTIRLEDDNEFASASTLTGCMGEFVNFDFNGNGCTVQGGMYEGVNFQDNAVSRFQGVWFDRNPGTSAIIGASGGATIVNGCYFNGHGNNYVLEGLFILITNNLFFTSAPLAVVKMNEGEGVISNNYFISSGVNIDSSTSSGQAIFGNQYGLQQTPNALGTNNVPGAEVVSQVPTKGPIFVATQTVTIANSGADTSLIGTGVGVKTFPSFWFETPGRTIRIKINGFVSDTGTPNYTINLKKNGTVIATVTKAFAGVVSNAAFTIEVIFTGYTAGVGGTAWAQGGFAVDAASFNFAGLVNTATTALNTHINNTFDVSFQWGAADPANTITATNVTFEAL